MNGDEAVLLGRFTYLPKIVLGKGALPLTVHVPLTAVGAFGEVFQATEIATDRQVAIKKSQLRPHTAFYDKRTLREIKILRQFAHENVVKFV